jgi:hypothetical protein
MPPNPADRLWERLDTLWRGAEELRERAENWMRQD